MPFDLSYLMRKHRLLLAAIGGDAALEKHVAGGLFDQREIDDARTEAAQLLAEAKTMTPAECERRAKATDELRKNLLNDIGAVQSDCKAMQGAIDAEKRGTGLSIAERLTRLEQRDRDSRAGSPRKLFN